MEAVIEAAVERNDLRLFEEFLEVLSSPYKEQTKFSAYAEPPKPHERIQQTFCGT
jgi:uncharacterized protein YdiU (UPF0061 family)